MKFASPKTRTSFASRTFDPTPIRYHARRMTVVSARSSVAWRTTPTSTNRRTATHVTSSSRPSHQL